MDPTYSPRKLPRGTMRRVLGYARPYRRMLVVLIATTALDALLTVVNPLLSRNLVDDGVLPRDGGVVLSLSLVMIGVALFDCVLGIVMRWHSAKIGQHLTYDLRTQVFRHVLRQPLAFFTRAQTGALVSRLNTDVIGAQQAITTVLASAVSNVLSLIVMLVAIFYLSWIVGTIAVALVPVLLAMATFIGKRLEVLARQSMQLDAEMGTTMTERFNVGGAMLVKLFGRPNQDARLFDRKAARVRDVGVKMTMYNQSFTIVLMALASLAAASVYGVAGTLIVRGDLALGSLVALTTLVARLYGPISGLTNIPLSLLQALVSFDRVFEVLDLEPLVDDKPGATPLAGSATGAPAIDFTDVRFRYPSAAEVSLASLESIARRGAERADGHPDVLRGITFHAPAGRLTALVGPSGAGKTTISHLAARLYDPDTGEVRVGGQDIKEVTQESLHEVLGVVAQDPFLFHDTIRANLAYADPEATEEAMLDACRSAQIWELVSTLPDGLETVVGDRGYRLSGGEKQRLALARLMLKAPAVVILDEATAHLDAESEAAVQRALHIALAGRTSLVIAHRLSTIRRADQILVLDHGEIVQRGRHAELLAAGGLYADLYRTQFADQQDVVRTRS
jgi:ATP-binding cassette subfamily B protein